jgi:hypothetical protein
MKRITAWEFLGMIAENPSVFEHWDTPLEIEGHILCIGSPITHLSPYLTFKTDTALDTCATFGYCRQLQNATGTFYGSVSFGESGIKRIENLNIKHADKQGIAANFEDCLQLEIATGSYPGWVSFNKSGIHSIKNLQSEGSLCLWNCPNLLDLSELDLSKPIIIEAEKLAAEKERRALLRYKQTAEPNPLPFL